MLYPGRFILIESVKLADSSHLIASPKGYNNIRCTASADFKMVARNRPLTKGYKPLTEAQKIIMDSTATMIKENLSPSPPSPITSIKSEPFYLDHEAAAEAVVQLFEKRLSKNIKFNKKAVIEKDIVCLDLEPRAKYYYSHVQVKKI